MGVLGPLHRPGTQLGWLPSAALLGPSAPALTFNRPPIFLMLRPGRRGWRFHRGWCTAPSACSPPFRAWNGRGRRTKQFRQWQQRRAWPAERRSLRGWPAPAFPGALQAPMPRAPGRKHLGIGARTRPQCAPRPARAWRAPGRQGGSSSPSSGASFPGVLGQRRPKRLPPREVLFGQLPQHLVYSFAERPITCSGVLRSLNVVPSPNWPKRLSPQVQTVPSPLTAMLWA